MFYIGIGSFVISFVWRYLIKRRRVGAALRQRKDGVKAVDPAHSGRTKIYRPIMIILGAVALAFPFLLSTYQVNIMTTALMYVVLALGLNIVVGQAGLLHLGYAAFYAAGALYLCPFTLSFRHRFLGGAALGGLTARSWYLLGFPVLRSGGTIGHCDSRLWRNHAAGSGKLE